MRPTRPKGMHGVEGLEMPDADAAAAAAAAADDDDDEDDKSESTSVAGHGCCNVRTNYDTYFFIFFLSSAAVGLVHRWNRAWVTNCNHDNFFVFTQSAIYSDRFPFFDTCIMTIKPRQSMFYLYLFTKFTRRVCLISSHDAKPSQINHAYIWCMSICHDTMPRKVW